MNYDKWSRTEQQQRQNRKKRWCFYSIKTVPRMIEHSANGINGQDSDWVENENATCMGKVNATMEMVAYRKHRLIASLFITPFKP